MIEFMQSLTFWQGLAFAIIILTTLYAFLCFIFSPITSAIHDLEKAIKKLGERMDKKL